MTLLRKLACKILLSAFLLIALNNAGKAQTALVAGDIVFTGYIARGPSTTTDAFSFVLLKAVVQNTTIRFTDYGWRTATNSFNSGGASTETEAVLLVTNPAGFPAGTEIKIENLSANLVGGGSAGTLTFSTGLAPDGSTFLSPFSLNGINGDQVLAYQGTMAAPTFIAGLHWNVYRIANGDPTNTTDAAWDGVVPAGFISASTSEKPVTLTAGTNALWIYSTADLVDPEKGNGRFVCGPDVSTAALIRTAVCNRTNWTVNDLDVPAVGFTLPTGCNYLGILAGPPAFTTHPSNSTICQGTNTSFTIVATGATSYQWQVDQGAGFIDLANDATYSNVTTTTLNITAATIGLNGYLYRCGATNGSGTTFSNAATLTVTPLPVNPTILLKTPATVSIADGTPVSATFNAGSGGTGCTDDYRYTIDGGTSYLPYTPGNNISTTGLAAGTGYVFIEGRRAACASLCQGSYIVLAAWYVTPLPVAATTLNAGDIGFSGYTSTVTDEFSFVLLKNIGPGTVINFTCNGWLSATSALQIAEETVTWTSNAAYPAGTEIKISGLTATLATGASAGTVTGVALSLSTTGDQVLAYRGTAASPTFISAIHMNVYTTLVGDPVTTTAATWDGTANTTNSSALPPGLTTGVNAIWIGTQDVTGSEADNARYGNCAGAGTLGPINTLRAALNNQNNWIKDNLTPPGFTIPTGCLYFGLGAVPTITTPPSPSTVCAGTNTSFSIVAGGAITYQWQVDNGGGFVNLANDATYSGVTSTTLNINATPFSLNGYLYRCVATNVSGSTPSASALLTVNAVPVNPTLNAKTPPGLTVPDGTPVSATFNAGSGGTTCTDDFRYTIDNGASYLPYTPGNNISTTGLAAGSGFVVIEGRRAGCASACQGTYVVLASWNVTPLPAAPTTLNAGDIAFSGYAATTIPDEFSFVLLRNIGPGTVINFTDNGWLSTNVLQSAEQTITWTSPVTALVAGTEIRISGLAATRSGGGAAGTVTGTALSLITGGDQILAYRGTAASPTFISAIHMNVYSIANGDPVTTTAAAWDGTANTTSSSALPTGLTTGVNAIWIGTQDVISSEFDNARYANCAAPGVLGPIAALRALLNNQANWIRDNNTPPSFTLPTGCNYLSVLCPTITVINPVNTAGTAGTAFSETFTSTGGTPVVTYTTASTLPTGLTLSTAGVLSGTPTQAGTFPIVVTATDGNGCAGSGSAYTLVIGCPAVSVNAVSNQTVCNGAGTTAVSFSGSPAGTVFNWTNNTPSIGLAASGTGNIASFTAINTTNAAVVATITVTPVFGVNCSGTPTTFTITVNPTPTVNPVANQTVCNEAATAAVTFSGAVTGTVYEWTNNTASIGLAASGSGNIASFTATNATAAAVTATITVTPSYTNAGTTCTGSPITFTITVNPTPTVNAVSDQTVCNSTPTTAITFTGTTAGTVYNWTNNTPAIGLAASGSGNIGAFVAANATNAPVTATVTVTPSYTNGGTTCTGTPTTFTITVNPSNTVAQVAAQTVCNGSPTTAITFSSTATGGTVIYNWTGTDGTIGLPLSGSGNIASFTAINTGTTVVTDTIKVTAAYTNGGTTCNSAVMLFVITVNPTATVNTVADQTVCNGAPTAAINFSGPVVGTVYSWTNNTTSIGLAASGTGNIASFTATNATAAPVTATVTVTPVFYNQSIIGSLLPGDLTMPSRLFRDGIPATCAGKAFPGISGGAHLYDTYSFVNTTGQPQCVTISYTAKSTGDVFVAAYNGSFNPAALATNYIGDGGLSSIGGSVTTFSVNVAAGATLVVVALEANSAPCPLYVLSVSGIGASCPGTSKTFNITVNPTPTVNTVANQTVCNGAPTTAVAFSGFVPGTVFNWTNNTTSIGLAASGTGNIASFTATNATASPVTATVTVTPSYTNGGTTCTGTPITFTITVNPTPTVNVVANQTVCNGAPTAAVTFSGATVGTVYNWTNNTTSIGLAASGTGNIASFTATNATVLPVTATITVTPSYTNNGTTCTGTPRTFTITVNPTPTVNAVPNQALCNGAITNAVAFSGAVTGTVFNWTNTAPSIGLAASGSGNIAAFTAINLSNVPVIATISVMPSYTNAGTTCTGTPITFTITVNPKAHVNPVPNQVVCNGAPTTAITFSGNTASTAYNWTNNTPSIGLAASGTGNIASFTATNLTGIPVVATITVTPVFTSGSGSCPGDPITFMITVNPTPTVNAVANQTVCNAAPTTAVIFTGNAAGTVYNWTNNTPSIGLAASGSGNIASFTAINTTNAPVTATITVTPSYTNGGVTCTGSPITFTITVNPTATVNAVANQVVCNNSPTTAVTFTSSTTGGTIVYDWTNNTTSIGLAASGTGDIASFTAINTGTVPVIATITVSPSYTNGSVTCVGTPITFTITVNPTPVATVPANVAYCNGTIVPTNILNFTSNVAGTTFIWTNSNIAIGLVASGSGNTLPAFTATNGTNAPISGIITVTPSANGCPGAPQTFTITVNPIPTVNAVSNQVVCNGSSTTAVTFTGTVTGTVYNWTNNTPSIGLAASGSGNIASFTATNATNAPVTATITVTPSYTNGGTTCTGSSITFTITVNPTATVTAVPNQVVCNGAPTTAVIFTSPTTGGTIVYNWTNNNATIGLAASGTGNIASFTATNATNAPVTATITVTPTYSNGGTSCVGTPRTFTITVNPTATINAVANQVVCNGSPTTAVTFTSPTTGGTIVYNWTNNTTSIGLAASGAGNIASFNAINTGAAPVTATITVTPTYSNGGANCIGTPITFTITVNPTATVNAVANQVVCNGSPTTAVTFSSPTTGGTIVYNWTNNTTSIGLAASGTGNIASFNAVNATIAPVTATITVTPTYSNGGTTCVGTPGTFTITVNPTATVTAVANQVVCNASPTTAVTFSSPTTGGTIVYNWTNSLPLIGLAASGSGNIASFTAINTGTAAVTATITVTPTYTNGGTTCVGTPTTFTITVDAFSYAPTGATSSTTVSCGPTTVTLSVVGGSLGTGGSWKWYSGSCGGTLVGTGATLTNIAVNATTTFFVRAEGTCNTTTCASVTVTIHPQPTISIAAAPYTSLLPGMTTTLTATIVPVDPLNTIVWYRNGVVVPGASAGTYTVNIDGLGTYTSRVTTIFGCTALSNEVVIKDSISDRLFISPNPNKGQFKVRYHTSYQSLGFLRNLVIYDNKGARVYSKSFTITAPYSSMDVNITNVPGGLYFVMVTDFYGKQLISGKVIKQ